MLCYLALVWNDADPKAADSARVMMRRFQSGASNWSVVANHAGLFVCCHVTANPRANEVYLLPAQKGVVLGKLFEKNYEADTIPAAVSLTDPGASAIVASGGRKLLENYWGRYIAFIRDTPSRRCWVLRDPTGAIPCYTMQVNGVHLYFRRFEDCECLGPLSLSVNRHYLVTYLIYHGLFNRYTGLNEVVHVLPGECIEHHDGRAASTFYWNPLEVANRDVIEDYEEAVALTRRTVRACVHAWASCFDGILHRLSGGLDSSIVLACLKDAPTHPHVVCQNNYGQGSLEDERRYARLIANRCGTELVEQETKPRFRFDVAHDPPRTAEIFHWSPPGDTESGLAQLERAYPDLSVIFLGHGGDELFFAHGALPTAADYLYRHGLTSGWLRVAMEDAQVDGAALSRVVRRAFTYGILKKPWSFREVYARARHLSDSALTASASAELREELFLHPLFQEPVDVPPGKIWHAGHTCLHAHHKHWPHMPGLSELTEVWPLSSQPLIELSLRIPLYVLRSGGRDRSIARRAFQADLPTEIVQRRWKVTGNESIKTAVYSGVESAREVLLDGLLVNEGYLGREKVREALSPDDPTRLNLPVLVLVDYLDAEMWYRAWSRLSVAGSGIDRGSTLLT